MSSSLLDHPGVVKLLGEGARDGRVSVLRINELLGDLQIDVLDAEELFEALEDRAIAVDETKIADARPPKTKSNVQAENEQAQNEQAQTEKKPTPRKKKASAHGDLDEVLESLEELMNSPLGAMMAQDEAEVSDDLAEVDSIGADIEDSFQQYLGRMGATPLMEPEAERELAKQARRAAAIGDEAEAARLRAQLVEANWRMVVSLARKYQGRASLPLLDIVQEGNMGLLRAAAKWNPARKDRFGSYATWYVREAINRAIAAQARSIRLPGHLAAAIQKLHRTSRELAQELGREPNTNELAKASGMSTTQVGEALRTYAEPISFDSPVGDDENSSIGDIVAGQDSPFEDVSRSEVHTAIAQSLEELSPREKTLIEQRFGLGEYAGSAGRTLESIAIEMNLSRDRVRDLEIRALRKMRAKTKGTVLDSLFAGEEE